MSFQKIIQKLGVTFFAVIALVLTPFFCSDINVSYAEDVYTWNSITSIFSSKPTEIVGDGTALSPYQIRHSTDFAIMASLISRYPETYGSCYLILLSDIDMANVGTSEITYSGKDPIPADESSVIRYYEPIGVLYPEATFFMGGLNYNRFFINNITHDLENENGEGKLAPFAVREIDNIICSVVKYENNVKGWNLWSSFAIKPTGTGLSETDPYVISSAEKLAWITNELRYGSGFQPSTFFKLTQNIDLSAHIWDQMGTALVPFKSIFDFNRYSVSNITLEVGSQTVSEKYTIFGSVSYEGSIQNFIPSTFWSEEGNYALSFINGFGTAESPYQISTAEELARILYLSKNSGYTFENTYFILNNTIDLSLHKWEKIGSDTYPFCGFFNYNGYEVNSIDLGIQSGSVEPRDRWELFYKKENGLVITPASENITNWNLWISYASSGFAGGAGSIADPFRIENANQLAYLAVMQKANSTFSSGKFFILIKEIDLVLHLWTQIGSLGNEFEGNFNFNCKQVKNITLEFNPQNNIQEKELFGGDVDENILENWVPSVYWEDSGIIASVMAGNGSEINPYIITEPMQLLNLGTNVGLKYYKLNSQIDLQGYLWKPITFVSGILDAGRYQILNVTLNENEGNGFFSDLSTGTVNNWSPINPWKNYVTIFLTGTGTEVSPYQISTPSELAYLMREVNYNSFNTKGKYFELKKNINLANNFWEPIGTSINPFKGVFNSMGYSVNNISVSTENKRNGYMLFGLTDGAVFQNINQTTSWGDTQFRSGSYSSGNGTKDNPYVIISATELALLSYQTSTVRNFTTDKYFVLGSDISLVNHSWFPIGLPRDDFYGNSYCFSGNFDYAGYKVTNIYYEGSAVVGNVETKYELFFGLLRDEEDNVLANVTRWIPSESWVATGNIELIPHEIADDTNSAYLISNPMQLAYLADVFNGETAGYVVPDDFSGKTFKLGASIDLSNYLWNPIGTTSSPFNGKFYGNGYTISGIVVTEGNNGGLFGVVKNLDTKVKIENFEISEVNIRLDSIEGTRTSIGMLASSVENAQIKFIKTSGFIKSDSILTYSVGGLVGFATTTSFFACQSFAEISATQKSVQTKVTQIGGLVGYGSNVVINNSFFAGSINGIVPLGASTSNTFSMGGLLGFAKGISSTSVVDSFNAGVITANVISGVSYSIGGIVGEINSLTDIPNPSAFKKCYYFSNLTINNGINAFGIYPSGWIPPQSCVTKTDINFFKSSETYSNSSNWEYLNSWDFDTVWNQVINEKSEFPTLQAFGSYGIIANNTEVVGGRLIFANEDGELVENLDPESKIVERKYRYQDNVQFYVEVDEHYSYGKNVKLDGVTLQNAIVWETLTIGEIVYDAFTISVNSNTCGSYSVEFTPAYYTLSISVEEDIEGALGGYIKFDNSDKFSQRDYDVSYLRTFILTAEPKTDYAFVGWFKSVLVVVEEGAEPPIEPTYELVLVSDSNEPLTVTMQGENATYVARFTKNICNLTIVQIGGEGGIFSFRDGQPSETVLVGKMLLNAEGKVSLEVKDGYTFVGWFINENDAEPVSTELDYIMEYTTTEYTLYAKFIPPEIVVENNPLTIILIIGGGVLLLAIIVIIIVVKKKRGGSNYRNNFNF